VGTSKSFTTPSGGSWTPLKNDLSDFIAGKNGVNPAQIIAGTIRALGSLGMPKPGTRNYGGSGSGTGGGGGGGSIGRTASGVAGFGSAVRSGGLDAGLSVLGLDELRGRSAAEVIAQIAAHLAEDADPLEYELLSDALRAALMEAVALQSDGSYKDLETAIQGYLDANGIEGLIKAFLTQYVFDRIWMAVENHVEMKSQAPSTNEALSIAVHNACRSQVESLVADAQAAEKFNRTDWFGRDGVTLCNELVAELETRLRTA
jgi:hypothetical protein